MLSEIPFQYEVRFRLIVVDKENNLSFPSYTGVCTDKDPLKARKEAFDLFEEYLDFPSNSGNLAKDERGNLIITQPLFVEQKVKEAQEDITSSLESEEISLLDKIGKEAMAALEVYENFLQEISIVLKITDPELIALYNSKHTGFELDDSENEYIIHSIASRPINEDMIMDNLSFFEPEFYKLAGIDISNSLTSRIHYGVDYAESGEEDGAEENQILPTPHIWKSYEEYQEYYPDSDEPETRQVYDFEDMIDSGESNQIEFKSYLLYDKQKNKAGDKIKFTIAKTICSFLNSKGGILFVGVSDKQQILGLDSDYGLFDSDNPKDKLLLEFDGILKKFFGVPITPMIDCSIERISGKDVFVVVVHPSPSPVIMKSKRPGGTQKILFVRMNASSHPLTDIEEIIEYIFNKKWGNT